MTGRIVAKEFVPRPEHQVTLARRGGLAAQESEGDYILTVEVVASDGAKNPYNVWVNKKRYDALEGRRFLRCWALFGPRIKNERLFRRAVSGCKYLVNFLPVFPMSILAQQTNNQVQEARQWVEPLVSEVSKVVVGQKKLVHRLLTGLLCNGHVLLEGVPGLAKTLTVRTLASCIRTGFQRIQFTPDLLPADLIGTLIYNPRDGEFSTKLGPDFFKSHSWRMRSTAPRQRCKARCSKRCRNAR